MTMYECVYHKELCVLNMHDTSDIYIDIILLFLFVHSERWANELLLIII